MQGAIASVLWANRAKLPCPDCFAQTIAFPVGQDPLAQGQGHDPKTDQKARDR